MNRNMLGFNKSVQDSSGIFLLSELERLDPILHFPLASVTWGRDINLRTDVTIADDISSFTLSEFGAPGLNNKGKNWIAPNSTEISGVGTSIDKRSKPLHLWGTELAFTIPQLAQAMQVNRPLEDTLHRGLQLKYQMDTDEQVYIGDSDLKATGLVNSDIVPLVPVTSVGGKTAFADKTPEQILEDFNLLLTSVWTNSALAFAPTKILMPPHQYGILATRLISTAGNQSVLSYIKTNNISTIMSNQALDIQPVKWLTGRGANGADRMVAYTQDPLYVRFPLVPMQRTPLQFKGISHLAYYYCKLGEVETVYPETIGYMDGI